MTFFLPKIAFKYLTRDLNLNLVFALTFPRVSRTCAYVSLRESPSYLIESRRVTRSFGRHDSITISVTRENTSALSFLPPARFSHAKPRVRPITLVAFAQSASSIRIFHYQGIKASPRCFPRPTADPVLFLCNAN